MIPAVPLEIDAAHGRMIVGAASWGKSHILHCNYYNNYLLRTIWKDIGQFVDAEPILIGAAAEQSFWQLNGLFESLDIGSVDERKAFASRFYAWQGLGLLDFGPIGPAGGITVSDSQHYAEGWKEQFGRADAPVGFLTRGWLAGAAAAIFGLAQNEFATHQLTCAAVTGEHRNVFALEPGPANFSLFDGRGLGPLSVSPARWTEIPTHVATDAVRAAVLTLPLFGAEDVDQGLIRNFDVMITWHPHQFYDRVSFECLHEAVRKFGIEGRQAVEPLLEEAGHRCGFRTFGGLWRSPEWAAIVEPMCRSREDWVVGLLAIINCAGWGHVQCTKLSAEEAIFVVHDDYESVGYLNLYGRADFPVTYLLRGGFRGIMNLLYNGGIEQKPALTEEFYQRLCRRDDAYEASVERCTAMGDSASVYRVVRRVA